MNHSLRITLLWLGGSVVVAVVLAILVFDTPLDRAWEEFWRRSWAELWRSFQAQVLFQFAMALGLIRPAWLLVRHAPGMSEQVASALLWGAVLHTLFLHETIWAYGSLVYDVVSEPAPELSGFAWGGLILQMPPFLGMLLLPLGGAVGIWVRRRTASVRDLPEDDDA